MMILLLVVGLSWPTLRFTHFASEAEQSRVEAVVVGLRSCITSRIICQPCAFHWQLLP